MRINTAKQFVQSVYPDAIYEKFGSNVYTGAQLWIKGQGYIGRVKRKTRKSFAVAYDIIVSHEFDEGVAWKQAAKKIMEQMEQDRKKIM